MKIRDFGVEIWMNAYENDCTYNLAETCVCSLSVAELLDLSNQRETVLEAPASEKPSPDSTGNNAPKTSPSPTEPSAPTPLFCSPWWNLGIA